MSDARVPVTQAIRFLRQHGIPFVPHFYKYEEKGGTSVSARELKVPEHIVIKTLIMETEKKTPLIVLMHGDKQVSTKELARVIGVKTVSPCAPDTANRNSGYQVGGTSPFGTRKTMPVYIQKSILELDQILINGGSKGFLVSISPKDAQRVLNAEPVDVAINES